MKILVLVPARGGSKRLPGKNIRPLAGRPLIAWTISAVTGLDGVADILVSTDDPAIAAAGAEAGALVPWMRPEHLASDHASSLDVALHALDWYEAEHEAVDGLLLLQPTSPLRQRTTVEQGMALFEAGRRAVVGISAAPVHPQWCFRIVDGTLVPFMDSARLGARSQDLDPAYAPNGAFYLIAPSQLRSEQTFFPADAQPLSMSAEESVDIDTEWDFRLAEAMSGKMLPG